jgi:hypothetical protein
LAEVKYRGGRVGLKTKTIRTQRGFDGRKFAQNEKSGRENANRIGKTFKKADSS